MVRLLGSGLALVSVACTTPPPPVDTDALDTDVPVDTDPPVDTDTDVPVDTDEPVDTDVPAPQACSAPLSAEVALQFTANSPWVTPADNRLVPLLGQTLTMTVCVDPGPDLDAGPGGSWEATGTIAFSPPGLLATSVETALTGGQVTFTTLPAETGVILQMAVVGQNAQLWTLEASCIGVPSPDLVTTTCSAEATLTGIQSTQITHWVMGSASVDLEVP
ncbi:MAG: hypothetical protein R3F61_01650 [Myxococcota bacterium]